MSEDPISSRENPPPEEISNVWALVKNNKRGDVVGNGVADELNQSDDKKMELEALAASGAATLWAQARKQMLALEERSVKRVKAEEARAREREASVLALRKQVEDAAKRNQVLKGETASRREEELRLEEEKRAEARRREREQRETMAPTVQFEEVWEVFG